MGLYGVAARWSMRSWESVRRCANGGGGSQGLIMRWTPPAGGIGVPGWCCEQPRTRETSEMQITTIGLDVAKNVFQVHGVDEHGEVVLRKQLRRAQVLAFF